ncbi:FH2 [Parelaphostrongylus tenuis]|uniref:FH2 n=1 Tax=Parelaphostrongylus tenuis TaxID=148309 RepID=A0AAD5QE38_PARTN|nr:FH2 [Parelaphostrongylus tenuis]
MLANMNGLAAPSPTAVGPPPTSRTISAIACGAPPTTEVHECSASPTNTSGSDVSGLSSSELAAIILAGQQNVTIKQDFPETLVKRCNGKAAPSLLSTVGLHPSKLSPFLHQHRLFFHYTHVFDHIPTLSEFKSLWNAYVELPPMANPLFGVSDAAALLQFLQAQQAVAQFHAQAQAAAQQRAALHQQQQQQTAPSERKRSYPCTFQFCVICQKDVHSSKLPCHIRQCHVAKPMFQCPACDFTSTYSKNNVKSHMVSLHGLAGDPISYMDKYAAQVDEFMKMCFPNVRGRGRPMQGRASPRSPTSPQQSTASRRNSQQNPNVRRPLMVHPQHDMLTLTTATSFTGRCSKYKPVVDIPTNADNKAIKLENADSLDNGVSSSGSAEDIRSKIVGGRSLSNFVLSMRSQTSRPGESVQPRYLKTIPSATVLDDEQVKDTIFEAVPTALTAEVVEYVRDQIEDDTALLSEEQHQRVTDILRKVNLKKFEIEFSIHRLDMTVLPVGRASLVLEAVPSAADVERIRRFTAAHPNSQWTEAEQFVIDLASIERAEEKLTVMVHTATFDDGINAINEQLNAYSTAAKLVQESEQLRLILQAILTLLNHLNGTSLDEKVVVGFCTSQLSEVCAAQLADGSSVLQTLTAFIRDRAPYASDAAELVEPLSTAAKVSFLSIYESLLRLDENNQRVQVELEQLDFEHPVLALRLCEMRQRLEEMAEKLVV